MVHARNINFDKYENNVFISVILRFHFLANNCSFFVTSLTSNIHLILNVIISNAIRKSTDTNKCKLTMRLNQWDDRQNCNRDIMIGIWNEAMLEQMREMIFQTLNFQQ